MNKIYFTKEMINFYEELARNNNKEWFTKNRHIYDNNIIPVAKEYVVDMGEKLKTIVPDIQYTPKIDGSIFRIHKDIRINKGRPPFKTHLGIIFYLGNSRLESPCFYFHIEPPFYYTGVGIAKFSPEILKHYRIMVNDNKYKNTLINIKDIVDKKYYNILGDKLKNIPKNIQPISDIATEFLKYKSIYINDEMPINKDFYSNNLFTYTFDVFKELLVFFNFLKKVADMAKNNQQSNL